jgi:hypothetical protein
MKRRLLSLLKLLGKPVTGVGWDRMSTRLGVALLIVSAIFFAANFADKAWLSYQVSLEKRQAQAQIAEIKREIGQYHHDLAYYHSRAFYVQKARVYGYVLPGDTKIQVGVSNVVQPTTPSGDVTSSVSRPATSKHSGHLSLLQQWARAIVPGL